MANQPNPEQISTDSSESVEKIEVLYTVLGQRKAHSMPVISSVTVAEFIKIAAKNGEIDEVTMLYLEDADEPLGADLPLVTSLASQFSLLHLGSHHQILATVEFNGHNKGHEFKPNTTVKKVIKWAVGPDGFNLEEPPHKFQIKYKGEVLPPETHIGQLGDHHENLKFDLVMKVRPQG